MKKLLVLLLIAFSCSLGIAQPARKPVITKVEQIRFAADPNTPITRGVGVDTDNGLYARDSLGNLVNGQVPGITFKIPLFGVTFDSAFIQTGVKYIPGWHASRTFVIDTLGILNQGGSSPSITVDIHFGTDLSTAGTAIITTPDATTTVTTLRKISTFDNATIAAGNTLWVEFDAKSGTTSTTQLMIVIIGHFLQQ